MPFSDLLFDFPHFLQSLLYLGPESCWSCSIYMGLEHKLRRIISSTFVQNLNGAAPAIFRTQIEQIQTHFEQPQIRFRTKWKIWMLFEPQLKGTVSRDFLTLVFFIKQLLLVPLDMPKKDFEFFWLFNKLFVFVIDSPVYSLPGSWDSPVYSPPGSHDSPVYSWPVSRDSPVVNTPGSQLKFVS